MKTLPKKTMTPVENIKEVEELFKMVYMWGRIGMQVDYKAPAFQQAIKDIKKSEYVCPANLDDIDGEDECLICKRKF